MKKTIIVNIFIFSLIFFLAFVVALMILPQVFSVANKDKISLSQKEENPQSDFGTMVDKELRREEETNLPLQIASGYNVEIFAEDLGKARDITHNPSGGILVSVMDRGKIIVLRDNDFDNESDERVEILDDLYNPHGVLAYCIVDSCKLYVAETNAVSVYDYDPEKLQAKNRKTIISLPDDGGHYTRSLLYTTIDGVDKLFISIGSSCNVCDEDDERRSKIFIANMDGSDFKEYASGLRNSVFMTQHPVSGDIWATEMGRDWLGDDLPPDEVNIIKHNQDYGWPLCYGQNIHDQDFDKNQYIRNPCEDKQAAKISLPAHVAPLGLAFIPEEGYPEDHWYNLLVAYHGSWNRSQPSGYKVVRFAMDANGNVLGQNDFISGWIDDDQKVWGRPVDILIEPGGRMYISDDHKGVIYIVSGENTFSRIEEVLDKTCTQDLDCELPMEYAIRSSCPFDARCINDLCTVVCPFF